MEPMFVGIIEGECAFGALPSTAVPQCRGLHTWCSADAAAVQGSAARPTRMPMSCCDSASLCFPLRTTLQRQLPLLLLVSVRVWLMLSVCVSECARGELLRHIDA